VKEYGGGGGVATEVEVVPTQDGGVGKFMAQKQGLRCFQICTRQKLLLTLALDGSQPLSWAVGFCQKQKHVKAQPKTPLIPLMAYTPSLITYTLR
jgi:hypothetical protein